MKKWKKIIKPSYKPAFTSTFEDKLVLNNLDEIFLKKRGIPFVSQTNVKTLLY